MSRLAELLVLGLSFGTLYALMGMSVTLVYQATRIPNVAFVGIGAAAAVFHWDLTSPGGRIDGSLGWWAALPFALAVAAVLGAVTHFLVASVAGRLVPSLLLLLGWTATLLAGVNTVWGTGPKLLANVWDGPAFTVGDVAIRRQTLGALAFGALCLFLAYAAVGRSRLGLALRVSAGDTDAAGAAGVDTRRLALRAWVISSVLAGVAVILITYPVLSNPYETTVYLPFAFGAALLGSFRSLPLAALGGLALGVVPTLLDPGDGFVRIGGVRNLVALVLIVVLLLRRPWVTPTEPALAAPDRVMPALQGRERLEPLQLPAWARRAALLVVVAALAVAVPVFSDSDALTAWTHGLSVFLVCSSIVMVLGWSGDVALGQVAFAGVGAYMVANLAARLEMPHILALPLAVIAPVLVALAVGLPTLRAERNLRSRGKGLRLPFTVLSVGVMVVASSLLWGPNSRWFTGDGTVLDRPDWMEVLFGRPAVSYYLLCLALTAGVVWFASNLRSSRIGRAVVAAQESPAGARSVGIDPSHYRLVILVFSAVVAALGGIVHAYLGGQVDPGRFAAFLAVQYLLYAVVGGAGSLAGVAVVVFAFEVAPALGDGNAGTGSGAVVLLGLLAVVALRFVPDGLAGLARRAAASIPGLRPEPNPIPVSVTLPPEEVNLDAW